MRLVPKMPMVMTRSLHFLRAFLMAFGFGTTGFSLDKQIHVEFCNYHKSSLLYLVEVMVKSRLPSTLLDTGVFYLKKSIILSGLLCLAKCGRGFLQERDKIITIEESLVLSS